MDTENGPPRPPVARLAAITLAISTFFAVVSPFEAITYLSFPERLIYWLAVNAEVFVAFLLVKRLIPAVWASRTWPTIVGATVLGTPIVFLTIVLVQRYFDFERPPESVVWMILFIGPVVLAVVAVLELASRPQRASALAPTSETEVAGGLLRERLPIEVRDEEILALAAEDHYVAVHTAKGSPLVHFRFADAVRLMSDDGVQVHRSWWVAKSGVDTLKKAGGKILLRLVTGVEVPVSKSGAKKLREAGWL